MDHQALTTILFLAVVALTVGITFWASRQTSGSDDFYAGGRSFSPVQNVMPTVNATTARNRIVVRAW